MRLFLRSLLVLFLFASAQNLNAQAKPSGVCGMLSAAEITAALATPGPSVEGGVPVEGGAVKLEMKMCSWKMPWGGFHLSYTSLGKGVLSAKGSRIAQQEHGPGKRPAEVSRLDSAKERLRRHPLQLADAASQSKGRPVRHGLLHGSERRAYFYCVAR